MTTSSQKLDVFDFLLYMDETSTPEVQIVTDRVAESVNVPQVGVVEFSDHALKENFDRELRRAKCSPSDMDNSFISHVQFYQSELCRSSISSTPKVWVITSIWKLASDWCGQFVNCNK